MEPLRRLAPGAYFIAALLLLVPALDYVGSAWPFRPDAIEWRFTVVGMISTYLLLPLVGLLLASATAAWLPQPRVSRVLGVLIWGGSLLLVALLVGFVLDSLQVRNATAIDDRWVTTTNFLRDFTKILGAALTLMILGMGNLRAGRDLVPSTPPRKVGPLPSSVTGRELGSWGRGAKVRSLAP